MSPEWLGSRERKTQLGTRRVRGGDASGSFFRAAAVCALCSVGSSACRSIRVHVKLTLWNPIDLLIAEYDFGDILEHEVTNREGTS